MLLVGLAFSGVLFSQAQKDHETRRPVDIRADFANRYPELGDAIVLTGNVVFHHNGAVIVCDSAIRYSDRRIDCFRNIIINKDSTYIYGDRAEYNGDINLARVYSPIVKVINGDAILYTYNFTFNTLDNIGTWYGGGVLYQKDNVLESEKGYFYSDLNELVAMRNVEMKNDDYAVISDSVRYNTETKVVHFYTKTYIWTTEGEIITADKGRYNTQDSTYFFHGNAYVLTDFRETWADTIDFNAKRNDAILYGNIQIDDNEHSSSAFGDYGRYWGARGETMLTKRPSIFNFSEDYNNSDTLFMRADTIFMYVTYPSDRKRPDVKAGQYAHLKWVDTLSDPVRLVMADSLRKVISHLRTEAAMLSRRADSIMNALYPPLAKEIPVTKEVHMTGVPARDVGDSIPPAETIPVETLHAKGITDAVEQETPSEEPLGRRRDRRRGPDPELWLYPDTSFVAAPVSAGVSSVFVPDSVAGVPPTSIVTDSLSHMEKVRELLPSELSGQEAGSLLEMLGDSIPESMSHLVSDSIDVSALKSVIKESVAVSRTTPSAPTVRKPEPPKPERTEPTEVTALRVKAAGLTARADSLQATETYIRPKPQALPPAAPTAASPIVAPVTDSLLVGTDTIAVIQPSQKALKKIEKEKRRVEKAELKAAKKAAKQLKKQEKQAAQDAKRAEKEAARRRTLIAKGRLRDSIFPADSLFRLDSLALADSLMRLDSLARIDSMNLAPPKETASEPDTTERIFKGWRNVKIWRKDMQAVSDSIVGFSRDSTIRMYINPILWQGQSQIVSDSLTIFTANEAIERAEFFGNPIMGMKISEKQFNQATGRTMTSWFRDNNVYRHDIYGNAEAFYYIQEEEEIEEGGVKKTAYSPPVAFIVVTGSSLTFHLEEQLIKFIVARENVKWPVYPIEQIPSSQPTEIKGFRWYSDRQPAREDVFDRRIRPAEREFHEALERPKFPIAARINRRREYLIDNLMWADRVDPLPAHAIEFVRSLQE